MKINKPTYYLKRTCPVCNQGSCLTFVTCESCGGVIIECAEEGSIFPDPKDLNKQYKFAADNLDKIKCPYCNKKSSFNLASGEEIQKLGFSPNDYE